MGCCSPVLNRVFILAGEGGLIFCHCLFLAVSSYRIGRRPRHFKPSRPQTGLLNHDVRMAHIRFLRKCRHSIASATRRISVPRLGTKSGETAQKRVTIFLSGKGSRAYVSLNYWFVFFSKPIAKVIRRWYDYLVEWYKNTYQKTAGNGHVVQKTNWEEENG